MAGVSTPNNVPKEESDLSETYSNNATHENSNGLDSDPKLENSENGKNLETKSVQDIIEDTQQNLSSTKSIVLNGSHNNDIDGIDILLEKLHLDKGTCRFTLNDLYKFSLKFYKDKSGKAIHLSYEDNCYFVALSQQIIHGPFNPATAKTLGVLDMVGKDRRLAWQALGDISKDEAIKKFVEHLNKLTPTFKPYIEAVLADQLEKERLKKEEEERLREEEEEKNQQEELIKKEEEERRKQEETKRQIQEALNQQTFSQFKLYSEQQFPGNPEQQAVLIKQLQEQHYQQYMQQVYQQQLLHQQKIDPSQSNEVKNETVDNLSQGEESEQTKEIALLENGDRSLGEDIHTDEEGNEVSISPASVWTRHDIKEFKSSISQEGGDSIIRIGHGETVTVRVPTHQDGAYLFWEFATDSYDIGFGVLFEWCKDASSTGVTVHVTDSDDEEDDDEEEEEEEEVGGTGPEDVERVAGTKKTPDPPKAPQSVIIPVYRRDSHEEVYAGYHLYPGSGVYLLKFDNSYSLWRNKVLYYRVYYTQR